PWGVAFTGAIALTTLLGIRSAEAAQQAENTKKALKDVLGDIADAGGGQGQVAESSLRTDELKGRLDETKSQIELFATGAEQQSHRIQDALTRAFDPNVNQALAGRSDFVEMFYSATEGVNNLIKRVGAGEVQIEFINREIRALPEMKFLGDDEIKKLSDAVAEAGKFELALNKTNIRAQQLQTTLDRGLGNINVEGEINAISQTAIDNMELYEQALKQSRKTAGGLLFDLQNINAETSLESDIRKSTVAVMKDNKSLLEGEARDVSIVSTVLDVINSSSDEWLRSTEATTGEFGRLLATAKQIAPAIDFSKKGLNSTQVAAVTDMLAKQTDLAKKEADRAVIGDRERSILEKQDSILDGIRQKYQTIEGVDLSQVNAAATALVDFDRGAGAIQRADAAIQSLSSDTASLGGIAQAAIGKYVVSLNGATGSLNAFRNTQAEAVNQIIANREDIKDVQASLTSYRGELERLILTSRQSLFGKLENTADVRNQISAVTGGILDLADRMSKGKLSAHDLSVGMTEIETKLKALGANSDALSPFIRSVLEAIAKVAQLVGALDVLKRVQGTIGGTTRAGLTGTRTVDPATGIGVSRFGRSGASGSPDGSGQVVRAVENGVGVTRFGQEETTAATRNVGAGVDTLNQTASDGFADLSRVAVQNNLVISKLSDVTAQAFGALSQEVLSLLVHNNDSGATGTGNTMFGDAFDPSVGSYISSWGIGVIKRPTLQTGPQDYGKKPQGMGNITVGDINVNGVPDGAEAGRQAAYEFIRTVYGAMSGEV
ncbi:hypothetical protein, partial [Mesorhizobium sp.]|uniref:hypothetical protein n=1 Tax=Mesorhizobium sp. TaxID=1871066 RepID=UPI0025E59C8C